jgi:hypothetical protein
MEHIIEIGGRQYKFTHEDLVKDMNVDREISIDYSNLIGERMVTPLISNTLGLYLAELNKEAKMAETAVDIYVEDFKKDIRSKAAKNDNKLPDGVKYSEAAIKYSWCSDAKWQKLMNEKYIKESQYEKLKVIYWKVNEKLETLKEHIKSVTPEEFQQEIIDDTITKFIKERGYKITNLDIF